MSIVKQSRLESICGIVSEDNESPTIEQVVYAIKNMPDHLMEYDHGIILNFSDQDGDGQLLSAIRDEYRIKAQWLEVLWLDRTELLFELTKTWKKHYKPFAEKTNAFWELARSVRIWLAEAAPDARTFFAAAELPKPLLWAFMCERYLCETKLKNSGYTAAARPKGKGKMYELACLRCDELEYVHNFKFGSSALLPPIQALEQTSGAIAQCDRDFREAHYVHYHKVQKRCFRAIERSPLKTIFLNEENTVQIMDKGHDTRKSKADKKGFG